MKAIAKIYFGKSKNPRRKVKLNGVQSVPVALRSLAILLEDEGGATRAEITITVPARRSS